MIERLRAIVAQLHKIARTSTEGQAIYAVAHEIDRILIVEELGHLIHLLETDNLDLAQVGPRLHAIADSREPF